ncbi:hypothetical protein CASFOL_021707 [Castilleja foliolosa]|uniref:Jacalin-type lectin domain-containing protein n=1 Tax=Castilleja foliolosa TaxID=1961234 RepID=A0ABD3CY61_9LAMI
MGHNKIAQIFISHDHNGIRSIQFQYVEDGTRVMSKRHGYGSYGSKFDVVKLNYSTEYITWISGYMLSNYLGSITFGTNHGEYGPFGSLAAKQGEFNLQVGDQFGGFHGYFGPTLVNSIGVYLKPTTKILNDVKSE